MRDKNAVITAVICCLCALPFKSPAVGAGDGPVPGWRLSAGPAVRNIRDVSFVTGSHALSGLETSSDGDADVGATDDYANRKYDDGYVRLDPGTGNDGDTWYWGYDHASQVGNDRLVFHARDGYETVISDGDTASGWDKAGDGELGVQLAIERLIMTRGRTSTGLELGIAYATSSVERQFNRSVTATTYERIIEDTYNLGGVIPPAAPYSGTENGPGPLLLNRPSSRDVDLDEKSTSVHDISLHESLDVSLLTLSLGLVYTCRFGALDVHAAVGPTVSMVSTKATHDETDNVTGEDWHDRVTGDDWKAGGFGRVGVAVGVSDRVMLGLSGRYDIMAEVRGDVGPSTFEVDPGGWSGAATVVWML